MTPPRGILFILALGSALLGFGFGARTALAHAIVVAARQALIRRWRNRTSILRFALTAGSTWFAPV